MCKFAKTNKQPNQTNKTTKLVEEAVVLLNGGTVMQENVQKHKN